MEIFQLNLHHLDRSRRVAMSRVLTVRHRVIRLPKTIHNHVVVVVQTLVHRVHRAVVDSVQAVTTVVVRHVALDRAQVSVKPTVKPPVVLVAHHVLPSVHMLVPENAPIRVKPSAQISALAHVAENVEMDVVEIAQEAVAVAKTHVLLGVLQPAQIVLANALAHVVETALVVALAHVKEHVKVLVQVDAKLLARTPVRIHVRVNVVQHVRVSV